MAKMRLTARNANCSSTERAAAQKLARIGDALGRRVGATAFRIGRWRNSTIEI
jgi:hypothetical protein